MDQLTKKYPLIFRAVSKPRRYPHLPIAHWGIECGQGWYPIIEDLAAWLENEAVALKAAGKRPPIIAQIKEKFGVLTIYVRGFPVKRNLTELYPRLEAACSKSKTVCEICGAPGTFRDGTRVRCDNCELSNSLLDK